MKIMFFFVFLVFAKFSYADIVSQNPSKYALNEVYNQYSKNELMALEGPDQHKQEYLLGLLYLNGDSEFNLEKDCSKASKLLENAWDAGIVDAGYSLALMYRSGNCLHENSEKAKKLLYLSAKENYLLSQRLLGRAYWGKEWKDLYDQDMKKAVFWLSKAASLGDSQSAAQLSYIYRDGIGVEIDEDKSFQWISKAASSKFEKGEIIYFPLLAKYFEQGIGTDINLMQAYKYYDLSGTAGVEGKQRVAKDMTQEQIDEAIRQSQAWQKANNVEVGGGFIRRAN